MMCHVRTYMYPIFEDISRHSSPLSINEAAVVIANLNLAVFNFTEQLFSSCLANRSQYKQDGLHDTYMLNKPRAFQGELNEYYALKKR